MAQSLENTITTRINHIALSVYDLDKSREFYEKIIQLKRIEEPFKDGLHEWFTIGGSAQFHLIKGATIITEHHKSSHNCFSVSSVDAFILHLNKHNIPFINWKGEANIPTVRVDGVKQIYLKDPDGYWIEINDAK
ncbi:MAG: VOC family protein [Pyrinomonadaceae bacterium]|nr:VOC family protein [Sphingobacteriaceae bacterium]